MSSIAAALYKQAASKPDKVALIFGQKRITYREFLRQAKSLAAGLADAGFRPGCKLGLMLPNQPEFPFFEYAAFILGGAVAPVNIHYKSSEIEHVVGSCDVEFLVLDAAFRDQIRPDIRERCTALERTFALNLPEGQGGGLIEPADSLWGDPDRIGAPVDRSPSELALMLHTSATTGKAKGVMLTLANLLFNYYGTPPSVGINEHDVILGALPLYNTYGLNQCINAMVVTGGTLVLLPRYEPLAALEAVQEHRCTFFPSVPAMVQKMLNHPDVARYDLKSMKKFFVGAAPVPVPLMARIYELMGDTTLVGTGYGLTEGTALSSVHWVRLDEQGRLTRPKSVGQALPGIAVMIQDEQGRDVEPGQVGEICVKGPNVMKGYYKQPAETARAIVDGWLHTGDLGYMEPDGHFAIVDRKKDVIIRGGQNIYPADIEEVLYQHPAVAEAAVVGVEDEVMGEVPKAFVALKPNAAASAEELHALCKAELAYYKVPTVVEILPELPKGPTGKILRRGLRVTSERVQA